VRILIADAQATNRSLLKAMVSRLGHDCLVASDGASAWELMRNGDIDLLFAEGRLAHVDGPQLCRRVRSEITSHYTYVVIVASALDPDEVLDAMSAGADDYVVKPVNALDVQACLVAAERVTGLHRQLSRTRARLEEAHLELLGRSLTDPLTNLGNRRRLEEDLAKIHARSLRSHDPYCVAVFDLDHFAHYNDRYGHASGDEALRQVAACLLRVVRAGESVYRYGGDELVLVMNPCREDEAVAAAERILHTVKLMALTHEARPGGSTILTLSAGVACLTPGAQWSILELIELAEGAVRTAKGAGGARVRAADVVTRADVGALGAR
jgi:diguanylate cyclase (GGDEF)-like protein